MCLLEVTTINEHYRSESKSGLFSDTQGSAKTLLLLSVCAGIQYERRGDVGLVRT